MKLYSLLFSLLLIFGPALRADEVTGKQESRAFVAEDITGWVKGAVYAKGYLFDCNEGKFRSLVVEGEIFEGVVSSYTKKLSASQFTTLTSAITGRHEYAGGLLCHYPHHGFVFFDEDDKPISYIEICFLCSSQSQGPLKGLSEYWDHESLAELVVELEMPIFRDPKDWAAFFTKLDAKADEGDK